MKKARTNDRGEERSKVDKWRNSEADRRERERGGQKKEGKKILEKEKC